MKYVFTRRFGFRVRELDIPCIKKIFKAELVRGIGDYVYHKNDFDFVNDYHWIHLFNNSSNKQELLRSFASDSITLQEKKNRLELMLELKILLS